MPTSEQLAIRRDRIVDYINQLRNGEITIEKVPYNFKVAVLGGALAEKIISPADVPPKIARDVSLNFLKEAPWRQRDAAADKGTEVHALADRISNGELVDIPDHLKNHVKSFQQFVEEYEIEFVLTEFSVYDSKHEYAGTGDFLAYSRRFPEWGLIAGDYKTSESGIWPDIALQLAALKYAEFIGRPDGSEDRDMLKKIKTCVGVQITGDGYKVVPVRVTEGTFKVFLSAINVARWKREYEQFALDDTAKFIPRKDAQNV